jgi:thymidylate kinase
MTFIIDVDVDTALTRIKKSRDTEALLFEKKEFLLKVRANYHKLKGEKNIHIIDGTADVNTVFKRVKEIILNYNQLDA